MTTVDINNKSEYINNKKDFHIDNFHFNVINPFGNIGSKALTVFYKYCPFFGTIVSSVFERAAKNDYKAELSKNREYQLLTAVDTNDLRVSRDIEEAYNSLTPDQKKNNIDFICKSVLKKITSHKDSLLNKFFKKEEHESIVRDYLTPFIYLKEAPILKLPTETIEELLQLSPSHFKRIPPTGTYDCDSFPGFANFVTFSGVNKYFNSFFNGLFSKMNNQLMRGFYMRHKKEFNDLQFSIDKTKTDQLYRTMPTRIKDHIDEKFGGNVGDFARTSFA